MTVAELIAKLQEFSPDHDVVLAVYHSPIRHVECPYDNGYDAPPRTVVLS